MYKNKILDKLQHIQTMEWCAIVEKEWSSTANKKKLLRHSKSSCKIDITLYKQILITKAIITMDTYERNFVS